MKNHSYSCVFFSVLILFVAFFGITPNVFADSLGVGALETAETEEAAPEVQEALALFREMKFEEAIKKLDDARSRNMDMAPSQLIMAQWLSLANQPRAVRQAIEQTVTKYPDDPEAYVVLAELNLQNGGITEAELLYGKTREVVQKFNSSNKRKANIIRRYLLGMAQVCAARGKNPEAIKNLTTLLNNDSKNVGAWNLLGMIQFQSENIPETLKAFEKAKELEPKSLVPEARVAMLYHNKNARKESQEYMTAALNKAPNDVDVRLVAAQWALQLNSTEAAAKQADSALKIDENSTEAQLVRGIIALHQKDFVTAERNFQKVLATSPSSFPATNNLALALCEQSADPAKLKKAEEYALVNVRMNNPPAEAFSTAAWVLYKKGEYNQALQFLQNAIRLTNGQLSPDMGYYLAATYAELNNPDMKKQAKEILTKVLETKQPFYKRSDAEALLKQL
ncbi:MAG: tetratricopeptide repeat protein [Planctomycetia bacterium]|nr:tetratricopeptide repeat protein [Planctomycetia bacterium]